MTSEVVAEIEAQVRQLRATGQVPPGLEDDLDKCFEEVAAASLAAARSGTAPGSPLGTDSPVASFTGPWSLAQLGKQATTTARRRLGPTFRLLERRAMLAVTRVGEAASIRAHVTVDHLERLAARSPRASRVLLAARPGESTASVVKTMHPSVEGPLLDWVLERLSAAVPKEVGEAPGLVLHAECGDGRIVEALVARGLDARGADPRSPVRADGDTRVVAAGALEYLGATLSGSLDGLLLTGVVDCLRPGEGHALAQLAAALSRSRRGRRARERKTRSRCGDGPGGCRPRARPPASPGHMVSSPCALRALGTGRIRA